MKTRHEKVKQALGSELSAAGIAADAALLDRLALVAEGVLSAGRAPVAARKEPDTRSKHPAVTCWKTTTGRYPPASCYDAIIDALGEQPDADRLGVVVKAWTLAGFNPANIGGQLDWYTHGIPERGPRGGAAGGKQRTQSAAQVVSAAVLRWEK